jgi:hypothetical protein
LDFRFWIEPVVINPKSKIQNPKFVVSWERKRSSFNKKYRNTKSLGALPTVRGKASEYRTSGNNS